MPNVVLKAHNYIIQEIYWQNHDLNLISSDISGKIFQWSMNSQIGQEYAQVNEESFSSMSVRFDQNEQNDYLVTNTYNK